MTSRAYRDGLCGGRHFPKEIIVLCVRWHVTYRLSYRDLAERWPSAACTWLTRRSLSGFSGTSLNT
jgi:hypothetical protein